jgi:hypothetical protein
MRASSFPSILKVNRLASASAAFGGASASNLLRGQQRGNILLAAPDYSRKSGRAFDDKLWASPSARGVMIWPRLS